MFQGFFNIVSTAWYSRFFQISPPLGSACKINLGVRGGDFLALGAKSTHACKQVKLGPLHLPWCISFSQSTQMFALLRRLARRTFFTGVQDNHSQSLLQQFSMSPMLSTHILCSVLSLSLHLPMLDLCAIGAWMSNVNCCWATYSSRLHDLQENCISRKHGEVQRHTLWYRPHLHSWLVSGYSKFFNFMSCLNKHSWTLPESKLVQWL